MRQGEEIAAAGGRLSVGHGRLICSCHNEGFSLPAALISVVLLDVGVKTRTPPHHHHHPRNPPPPPVTAPAADESGSFTP